MLTLSRHADSETFLVATVAARVAVAGVDETTLEELTIVGRVLLQRAPEELLQRKVQTFNYVHETVKQRYLAVEVKHVRCGQTFCKKNERLDMVVAIHA